MSNSNTYNPYDPSNINFDQVAIDGETVTVKSPSFLKSLVKSPVETLNYFSLSLKDIDINENGCIIIHDESLAKKTEIIEFSKHGGEKQARYISRLSDSIYNYGCTVVIYQK